MDLTVDEYIEGLFSKEAYDTPANSEKDEKLEMKLPKWFDEKLFNKGRRFYWRYFFGLIGAQFTGLIALFAIPTILEVLVNSHRSTSKYTAYKRYVSTFLHALSWLKYELKPGSVSWKSLQAVRERHIKAGRNARLKNKGTISQRDLAITQFSSIGFGIMKPDKFGVRQQDEGDWEAYNHCWKVIGFMLGLQDRYNMCRNNIEETRQVFQQILDRVYTPCLDNVPEYFEHMSRVAMDGLWAINSSTESGSLMYITKNLANVPGYILTESERINLQTRIKEQLNGKSEDIGVDSSSLVQKPAIEGLPERSSRLLYMRDYDSIDNAPEYKKLSSAAKYKIALGSLFTTFYTTALGRVLLNWYFLLSITVAEYFPYVPFFLYGIKNSYVNMFRETPKDNTAPKPNAFYQVQTPEPWYQRIMAFW